MEPLFYVKLLSLCLNWREKEVYFSLFLLSMPILHPYIPTSLPYIPVHTCRHVQPVVRQPRHFTTSELMPFRPLYTQSADQFEIMYRKIIHFTPILPPISSNTGEIILYRLLPQVQGDNNSVQKAWGPQSICQRCMGNKGGAGGVH